MPAPAISRDMTINTIEKVIILIANKLSVFLTVCKPLISKICYFIEELSGIKDKDIHLHFPFPFPDLRHVHTILHDVFLMFDQFVTDSLLCICSEVS